MKIKKLSEQINYQEITKEHKFSINGKEVRVIEWTKQDNVNGDYDGNNEVLDEKDLTEEEFEAMGEYMAENLELKEGKEWDTNYHNL